MATSPASPNYNTNQVNYLNQDYNSSNPRTIAANQQGMNAQGAQAAQQNATATQSYLNPLEQNLANGGGGYTADQISQIEMTPQQQANMVTQAGISAGTGTAAGVDAAQRATDATGGNPAALAAYRARAAQQEGAQAGNASVAANVGAQEALAGETEKVGQAQQQQQNLGLGLQNQYQQEQNQDVQGSQNRAQQGVQSGLNASQTPSTFDQVMGGISGALSFLNDGGLTRNAVVAEGGPEAVVKIPSSQPTPMRQSYMDDGMPQMNGYTPPSDSMSSSTEAMPTMPMDGNTGQSGQKASTPWYQRLKAAVGPGAGGAPSSVNTNPSRTPPSMQGAMSLGQGIGKVASSFMADGENAWDGSQNGKWGGQSAGTVNSLTKFLADGTPLEADAGTIYTKPTQVKMAPNEAAVPLGYRPQAKTRPSMAMPVVKQLQQRRMYGGM